MNGPTAQSSVRFLPSTQNEYRGNLTSNVVKSNMLMTTLRCLSTIPLFGAYSVKRHSSSRVLVKSTSIMLSSSTSYSHCVPWHFHTPPTCHYTTEHLPCSWSNSHRRSADPHATPCEFFPGQCNRQSALHTKLSTGHSNLFLQSATVVEF